MGQALRLASNFVVMNDAFETRIVAADAEVRHCLDAGDDGSNGKLLVASQAFAADWPTRERSPAGDELIILASGDVDLRVATADGIDTTRMTEPGTFVVVRRGAWYAARIRPPAVMLFVTPGAATEQRSVPAAGGEN